MRHASAIAQAAMPLPGWASSSLSSPSLVCDSARAANLPFRLKYYCRKESAAAGGRDFFKKAFSAAQ